MPPVASDNSDNASTERLNSAWSDWWNGTRRIESWTTLAWFDIVLRYRRSMLGPLWLTLSMALMLVGMGPLYSTLFGADLSKFFPHITVGLILWSFLSTLASESCQIFIASANYLKQGYFPISLFVWRTIARNVIQFAHQIVIYIPVAIWAGIDLQAGSLWKLIPAVILLLINSHAMALVLGLLCAKFRDVAQIVASIIQMLMFITPVFWMPESLPGRARFVLWNPVAQMLDLLRTPLLGGTAQPESWVGMTIWTILTVAAAAWLFKRYHRRVVYWL